MKGEQSNEVAGLPPIEGCRAQGRNERCGGAGLPIPRTDRRYESVHQGQTVRVQVPRRRAVDRARGMR